jgi:hypothetical protein
MPKDDKINELPILLYGLVKTRSIVKSIIMKTLYEGVGLFIVKGLSLTNPALTSTELLKVIKFLKEIFFKRVRHRITDFLLVLNKINITSYKNYKCSYKLQLKSMEL